MRKRARDAGTSGRAAQEVKAPMQTQHIHRVTGHIRVSRGQARQRLLCEVPAPGRPAGAEATRAGVEAARAAPARATSRSEAGRGRTPGDPHRRPPRNARGHGQDRRDVRGRGRGVVPARQRRARASAARPGSRPPSATIDRYSTVIFPAFGDAAASRRSRLARSRRGGPNSWPRHDFPAHGREAGRDPARHLRRAPRRLYRPQTEPCHSKSNG